MASDEKVQKHKLKLVSTEVEVLVEKAEKRLNKLQKRGLNTTKRIGSDDTSTHETFPQSNSNWKLSFKQLLSLLSLPDLEAQSTTTSFPQFSLT